jgi:hypothetical protein
MANAIRYSTTGDTQSLKKGNFFFGVGDVGKGPSSATTYYNGSTPSASGYTVYSFDASQPSRISYASPTSDSEFISITNVKSGQNFTGITQCLNWYATQTDHVSVNRDYESIITSGLTLCLDAGFTPSYTSSGTTWYDLSYSGNNGTLTNGPTFNSANGGSIVFDGVNDNLTFNSITFNNSEFTAEVFGVLPGPINLSNRRTLFGNELSYEISEPTTILMRFNTVASGITFINIGNLSINNGQTFHHVLVKRSGNIYESYQNGVLRATINPPFIASNGLTVTSATSLTHTYSNFGTLFGGRNYNGNLFLSRIYNRGLSSSEILQNYQAQFPRFLGKNIVMNGLVNYLDAGYNVSYPGTGTTWNNISGVSGGTGTLTNGPTYSSLNGGSIVFDGTNDYVSVNNFIGNLRTFTVCHFIYLEVSQNTRTIFSNYGASNNGWVTGISDVTNNVVKFYLGNTAHLYSNTVLTTGAWYQVSVTYNNGEPKIYINGIIDASSSQTITPASSYFGNDVGRLGSSTQFFNGKINSVQVYNRALNATEISQNYQSQLPTIVGENFITNGLVLYLDASYRSSYPTTGTTWNNVSGVSGGTNTLVNGPVYSGTSGGTITFDGTDDYADFNAPNLGTTTTVEMWCKIGSGYSNKMFFGWDRYDVWCNGGNIGFNTAASDLYGISSSSVSSLGLVNNWKHYVFEMRSDVSYTNNKIYINGTSQTLSQQVGTENASVRNFNNGNGRIAFWRNGSGAGVFNMPMECAVFKVYNRALTQNEINQNFNATKSRFGI